MGHTLMAMSGGVDSSVAAALLRQQGLEVTGCTMRLIDSNDEDIADAQNAAKAIGIPHLTVGLECEFERCVMSRFCEGYLKGQTPNPCMDCNRYIKFGALDDRRRELGMDFLATGHYARREQDRETGRCLLRKGADSSKDQSYVLAFLTQEQLSHVLFPLGELRKEEVRAIAADKGLANARKKESQDICFVPDGDHAAFIQEKAGSRMEPGPIFDEQGNRLGEHHGLAKYTIGQRKGLGIAARHPLFVISKSAADNALVVGPRDSLMVSEARAKEANLVSLRLPEVEGEPIKVTVKTHYRHKGAPAEVVFNADGSMDVLFDSPETRPAPGQAIVAYDGDFVIGAGIVC